MKHLQRFALPWALAAITLITGIWLVLNADAYERKSNRENMVRVDVVPLQLASGKSVKFEVRMNSHSGDLGQDMMIVSTLKDDQGREYRPMRWKGSPPGGHHRNGILEFPTLAGKSESVTLVIRDIADVPERIYKWKLE